MMRNQVFGAVGLAIAMRAGAVTQEAPMTPLRPDVLEAKREDRTRDPFTFLEENGYYDSFWSRSVFRSTAHQAAGLILTATQYTGATNAEVCASVFVGRDFLTDLVKVYAESE